MLPLAALPLLFAVAADVPVLGDVVHGDALLKEAGASPRVDGAWINRYADETILKLLESGKDGFPSVDSDNVLDRWDVLAALRARNTDLRDLAPDATHVYVAETKLDENAEKRLRDQARIPDDELVTSRRVFVVFALGDDDGGDRKRKQFVTAKDAKKRDRLKRDKKLGYVVFATLPGFRGGRHEVAFAVDKDIKITKVVVRDDKGNATDELNQAAQRFLGKGARGKYEELRAGGAGKAISELSTPLSRAFLGAMESVYMYEVDEREYFAFD
jgi:hypothetical protein